jgi:hypothetical protein
MAVVVVVAVGVGVVVGVVVVVAVGVGVGVGLVTQYRGSKDMSERDRVSEDELSHDADEMRRAEIYEEHQREAEEQIGYLDEIQPFLAGIENAGDTETRALLQAIRIRDINLIGLLVLQLLKAELVALLEDGND